MVHNIGRGPQLEDNLFTYPLTGHYRWRRRGAPGVNETTQPPSGSDLLDLLNVRLHDIQPRALLRHVGRGVKDHTVNS
ncbi:hypothetical protein [Verrucomicrobium spinosum]|uniref:hypothetical protein n=1 Tax=Verrucomicrobium spinosum TaxID=2736 RepID=UPI0031B60E8D